jgi:2-polyprenyl-6-methoxyphenol hydroxylase-like FAD-dependent oxidoreductase
VVSDEVTGEVSDHSSGGASGGFDVDVAIVGYGPVGQALAASLGAAGHRVACFERFGEIYRLPRAVHLDHEVMRLLQRLGLAEELAPAMVPFDTYHWFGADGETLMVIRPESPSVSGWEPDWLFFQPTLESALDACARANAGVSVERGWLADGLEQDEDGVTLHLLEVEEASSGTLRATGEGRRVRAQYVLGADGANSFVRESVGIERADLGFREQWLVVDVVPEDMHALDLPRACQWCDTRRPTTHVQSGIGHRRWEFMLLPGESADDFDEERAWALLAPWFTREDGVLLRYAVYEFRSVVAERMRAGRTVIVGDAAHLTPPFLGQGLCAGLRDAANVAWKLHLVLRGLAGEQLLDTIGPERRPQNEWIIAFAVELGKVVCELDPQKAAERDRNVRAAGAPPAVGLPPLAGGAVRARDPLAGQLALQGRVRIGDREGLMDDLLGGGFTLVSLEGDPRGDLDPSSLAVLEALQVSVLAFGEGAAEADGRTSAWLQRHGVEAVLVRPDLYVFGSVPTVGELPALIDDLRERLAMPVASTS